MAQKEFMERFKKDHPEQAFLPEGILKRLAVAKWSQVE